MNYKVIMSAIEIEKGKEPDFESAMNHVKGLSDKEVIATYNKDLNEDDMDELDDIFLMRSMLEGTIIMMRKAWNMECNDILRLELSKTNLIISGGGSYGDLPVGCNEIDDFVRFGFAKIAGFIVE